jgi:chemotaxis protein MotB
MARRRRRQEEEHENHERWLVSYADFITLLFAFFVVMYAISSVNEGKYRVLSSAIVDAFRSGSAINIQTTRPPAGPIP